MDNETEASVAAAVEAAHAQGATETMQAAVEETTAEAEQAADVA